MNIGHVDEISLEQVTGWAWDPKRPTDPVEVVVFVDGREHGRCMACLPRSDLAELLAGGSNGHHGFVYIFPAGLDKRKNHRIEVCLAGNGEILPGGRKILRSPFGSRAALLPVIITSRGRTGTTLLMNEFSRQPEIAIADSYPYEVKLLAYYASLYNILVSTKKTGGDDTIFAEVAEVEMKIGRNPWNSPDIHHIVGGNQAERLFADSVPERIGALIRGIVADYYGIISVHKAKPTARFFAEKSSLEENVRFGIRNIFGEIREIVLVRDPRDYLCSAKVFWNVDSRKALESMALAFPAIEKIHQEGRSDTLMIRYEDLVLQPANSRRAIYEFIGADYISENDAVETQELHRKHATTKNPTASVGRWRQDLSADDVASCVRLCGWYMERFGYEI